MDTFSLSFLGWKDWLYGYAYGVVFLTAWFIYTTNPLGGLAFAVTGAIIALAVYLIFASLRQRKANKIWLEEFNREHWTVLDQEMINAVTNRVCENHRGYSHFVIFRIATLALYSHFYDLSLGDDPRAELVVSAYREIYERQAIG